MAAAALEAAFLPPPTSFPGQLRVTPASFVGERVSLGHRGLVQRFGQRSPQGPGAWTGFGGITANVTAFALAIGAGFKWRRQNHQRAKHCPLLPLHCRGGLCRTREGTAARATAEQPNVDIGRAAEIGGTGGKALHVTRWPTKSEVFAAIPKDCYEKDTFKSLMYAASSVIQVAITALAAWKFIPLVPRAWPLWVLYALVQGTFATGCWVVAHECGHGAFSNHKWLQTTVGYVLHSAMLAPYYSWQRSHAVHHMKTNHLTEGETHVPKVRDTPRSWEKLGNFLGRTPVAVARLILRLAIGWPAYLLFGASGGPKYGRTSHFVPFNTGEKELFPGPFKKKVWKADVGIIATLAGLYYWGTHAGWVSVLALYAGPICVANAWLVLYTWLQHTDVDIPHYDEDTWTWAKGAFSTVDRPYGPMLDFLHHRIGSTHVAHHVNCTIPHYKAVKATEALKEKFPDLYLYDPTPIPKAMLRVVKNCFRVQPVPGSEGMHIFTSA